MIKVLDVHCPINNSKNTVFFCLDKKNAVNLWTTNLLYFIYIMKTISHLFFALAVMAFSVIATSLKAHVLASPNATGVCQPSSLDLTKVTYFNDNGENSAQAWGDHVNIA